MQLARIPQENPDPVFRVSAEHVLLYSNPAGEELCRVWGCRIGHKVPPVIRTIVSGALTDGAVAQHEVTFDSHTYWLAVAPSVADGYVNIYARDITEHKQAKEALREAEQKFRTIFDSTSDGIFLFELEARRFAMCNKSCLQMLGYTQAEFLNLSIADLHLPADLPFIYAQIEEFVKGRKGIRHDIGFQRKDGSLLFVDLSPAMVQLDGKRYVLVALKDITERKRMEDELRRYAEHLEELVAARTGELQESEAGLVAAQRLAHLGSWQWSIGEDTASWSEETFRIFGIARGPLQQHREDFLSRIVPEDRQRVDQALADALSGTRDYDLDYRITLPDGRERVIHAQAQVLRSGDGRPVMMHGTVQDITERKRAEEALAESRKKYRGLVEKINDWAWEVDADCVYTYSRPRSLELLGYAPEEIVGKTPFDFMPPAEAERVWNAFQPIYLERKSLELLENTLVRKDGSLVTVETSGMPVFVEDGSFLGYTGIDRDVTSRKRAEAALRESEQRYRRLVENLKGSHFVYRHDTTGMLTYVSESVTQVLGYTLDEGMSHYGKYFTDHPANQAAHRHTELTLQGIPQPPYEVNIWHKDGSSRWLEVQEVPVLDAEGRVVAVEGVAQDITERKQAEEALRQLSQRNEEALRVARMAHWEFDITTGMFTFNDQYYTLHGATARAAGGYQMTAEEFARQYVHPDDAHLVQETIQKATAVEDPDFQFQTEARILRTDGEARWVTVWFRIEKDAQGKTTRLYGVNQDITERKRAEEALRSLNERLELQVAQRTEELRHTVDRLRQLTLELSQAEDRERKRIAAILHEDVQQMLAAARFHLNLLGSGTCSAEESQAIVGQVRQMLRDAIERSRSLSHELSPAIYQVELIEILNWLAQHMQRKHDLTVRVEAHGRVDSPSEPLKAFLYKVAQELLFNVVKHAGVHEARVRVRRMGQSIYLSIVDQGRGFDPQELEGAAGFGLLSIRERVRLLGGQMKIRSRPGMGSRILIAVPDQRASGAGVP